MCTIKYIGLRVIALGMALLVGCDVATAPSQSRVEPASENSAAEASCNKNLKFDEGIGFYWCSRGETHFLTWTEAKNKQPKEHRIYRIPPDARFYVYGLDLSSPTTLEGTWPPHLAGYGFSYISKKRDLDSYWVAHFLPREGYSEKVYEIMFDGPIESLRRDKIPYKYFALLLPGQQAYFFRFDTEFQKKAEKALRDTLHALLSNSKAKYRGILKSRTLIFDSNEIPFRIRFTSFDKDTGQVAAEASGIGEKDMVKLDGRLKGLRTLELSTADKKTKWDLNVTDDFKLKGAYQTGGGMGTKSVEINLLDAE